MTCKHRVKRLYERSRSVVVAFRMDEEAATRLDALMSLSCLTKQDYIEHRPLTRA